MTEPAPRTVIVHPDADTLAAATAARLITRLIDLQSSRELTHIVLTGGTIGIAVLERLAASDAAQAIDWSSVHIWWGDERFLPAGDPERNETQARKALIDSVSQLLPETHVHRMQGPEPSTGIASPEQSAADYADELRAYAHPGQEMPEFDVLLLGMGPDGHVASLFPGLPGPTVSDSLVVAVEGAPKPPAERVSLTIPAIQSASEVWVIVAGDEKAPAVARALSSADVREIPAAGALGRDKTLWLLDLPAAGDDYALDA